MDYRFQQISGRQKSNCSVLKSHSPEYPKVHPQRRQTDNLSLQHSQNLHIWGQTIVGEEAKNRWLIESLSMVHWRSSYSLASSSVLTYQYPDMYLPG